MSFPDAFVAGVHLRWDGVWQRPHHLLTRLAQRCPVVAIEEPYAALADRDEVRRFGALTVVRPLRRRGWSPPLVDEAAIATARAEIGSGACGVWLSTPMMSELVDAFDATLVVFDAMDELANFDFAPPALREREDALLARADLVFTGGRSLYESRRAYGAKVHCFPSGVDVDRFAAQVAPHPLVAQLRGRVFAYVGVIDERLDYDIIAALADTYPGDHVVLAGPVVKVDPARLPQRANVHFTGRLPYDTLPSLLAGVDVALMPFAINRATASISPTKTLEYFAAQLPVVSTPVADVVHAYGQIVFVADGAAAFVAAVGSALTPAPQRLIAGYSAARASGWDAIFARMMHAVEER